MTTKHFSIAQVTGMTHTLGAGFTRTIILTVLLLCFGNPVSAQTSANVKDKGDPVIIALVPTSVTGGRSAKIVRDNRRERMNIVYINRDNASSLGLEGAMRMLAVAQVRDPHVHGKVSVVSSNFPAGQSADAATIDLFARLQSAPARQVGEADAVPAVIVYLPTDDVLKEQFKRYLKNGP